MTQSIRFGALICLAIVAGSFTQVTVVNFDGCAKNCFYCKRLSPYIPNLTGDIKSCIRCHNSTPRAPGTDSNLLDCSGPPIPNCQISELTDDNKVICWRCNPGFVRERKNDQESCVPMAEKEFENCNIGELSFRDLSTGRQVCEFCKTNFALWSSNQKDFDKTCIAVEEKLRIKGCDNYQRYMGKSFICNQCTKGYERSSDGSACVSIPIENSAQLCSLGWEKSKDQVTCTQCNFEDGFYSLDAFYPTITVNKARQRQICGKPGATQNTNKISPLLIIGIGAAVVLVVLLVVVLICKSKKSSNQVDLKGSMISNNQV